jgi:hypothetical protein
MFGLDHWEGRRWFGSSGERDGVVVSFGLGYGEISDLDAPMVRVTTHDSDRAFRDPDLKMTMYLEARALAQRLWRHGAEHSASLRSTFGDPELSEWHELSIPVDGRLVQFKSLEGPPAWIAIAAHGGVVISLEARNVAVSTIRLVEIDDLEPFFVDAPR